MVIFKEVSGRLGNQFFQYATLKSFKVKYHLKDDIILNFEPLKNQGSIDEGFCNAFKDFNVLDYKEGKISVNIIQKIIYLFLKFMTFYVFKLNRIKSHVFQIKIQKFINKFGIYFFVDGFYNFKEQIFFKDKIFYGNFESGMYFDNIKDYLFFAFTPKYDKLKKNLNLYKIIETSNSVCVSIRRGDFLNKEYINSHYVCSSQYFLDAISEIKKKIKDPVFIIFSDDINWCKSNISLPNDEVYFETDGNPVREKLRLMYSCRHFIISNSTFSWWAQYLSRNTTNKIVIAPKKRKNSGYNKDGKFDIYEDNWILI